MTGRRGGLVLDDGTIEQLLDRRTSMEHPDLEQAMVALRSLADGPAPQPTAALADLLDHGFVPAPAAVRRPPAQRRRRTWAARVGGMLAAGIASILVAGTAQALPPRLQDVVADLVSALTPFELPRSTADDGRSSGTGDDRAPASPAGSTSTPDGTTTPPRTTSAPAASSGSDLTAESEQEWEAEDPDGGDLSPEDQQRDGQPGAQDSEEIDAHETEDAADDVHDPAEDTANVDDTENVGTTDQPANWTDRSGQD